MFLGYNTNGFVHHDLFDAVELLAEIGYRGVAITIDHNALPPYGKHTSQRITRLRRLLERLGMRSVIETGARFLLDPRAKHEPTLLSEGRRQRIDFYKYAIDCAAQLQSDCVSLWSGTLHEPPGLSDTKPRPVVALQTATTGRGFMPGIASHEQAMSRLAEGLGEVLDYASQHGVLVGFEPEPGMLIDSLRAFEALLARIGAPNLRLTLDIGHLHCQGEMPFLVAQPPSAVPDDPHSRGRLCHILKQRLVSVHIEDMRSGVHEHLMFGEGEIDFPPILQMLTEVGYTGGVYVELSRHSHEGPAAAQKAFQFLQRMVQ